MKQHDPCKRCGNCCRGQFIIDLECLDIIREPRLLEQSKPFKGVKGPCGLFEDEDGTIYVAHDGNCHRLDQEPHCPFLTDDGCFIYATRPYACLTFVPGCEKCLEVSDLDLES